MNFYLIYNLKIRSAYSKLQQYFCRFDRYFQMGRTRPLVLQVLKYLYEFYFIKFMYKNLIKCSTFVLTCENSDLLLSFRPKNPRYFIIVDNR
jgi:hypothetical protein